MEATLKVIIHSLARQDSSFGEQEWSACMEMLDMTRYCLHTTPPRNAAPPLRLQVILYPLQISDAASSRRTGILPKVLTRTPTASLTQKLCGSAQ